MRLLGPFFLSSRSTSAVSAAQERREEKREERSLFVCLNSLHLPLWRQQMKGHSVTSKMDFEIFAKRNPVLCVTFNLLSERVREKNTRERKTRAKRKRNNEYTRRKLSMLHASRYLLSVPLVSLEQLSQSVDWRTLLSLQCSPRSSSFSLFFSAGNLIFTRTHTHKVFF